MSQEPSDFRKARLWAILVAFLPFLFVAVPARANDFVHWRTNYYSVTGATLVEIRESIRQSRPWKDRVDLDGMTEWRVNWNFSLASTPTGCRCSTFTIRTTITTTMPRWLGATNAGPGVAETWKRYAMALIQHEAGHARNAMAAATELRRKIQGVGEGSSCDALKQTINDLGQRTIEEFRNRDKEYDEKTRHGATEGAFLPGRGRRGR